MNPQLTMSLDDAVQEVLGLLVGLDLSYDPDHDRYRTIVRMLNRSLRANALEQEWSWYTGVESVGTVATGVSAITLPDTMRPRIKGDDAVRLVEDDVIRVWAYFLPRDAIHKYGHRTGLWVASNRQELIFSRRFHEGEAGWDIQCPVMREPAMFDLPQVPDNPTDPLIPFDDAVRNQQIDFGYPDVIVARAAYMYSLTDPVMQPRAQTLEAGYKDLMYQAMERDTSNTDTPFQNEFFVPVQNSIFPESSYRPYPLSDERR